MKLGYSITSFFGPTTTPQQAAREVIERAAVAREAGYDYIETGDHHAVTGGGYLQNVPTGGRLSAVFDHVAVMFLLPLYDPVLVAEQAGTLEALTDRFDLWCAVGGGEQFEAFGVPRHERAARFEEGLDLIRQLWDRNGVSFDGEFYAVDDLSVNPKADPRICIGGTARAAVERAGRLGDAWVANADVPIDGIDERIGWFTAAGGGDVIARREALVLEDGQQARDIAEGKLQRGYRGWPVEADWPLVGDVDSVTDDLLDLRNHGVDEVVVRPMSGSNAVETLRLTAEAKQRADAR